MSRGDWFLLGSMAKTMQSVRACPPHVTLCQLVESMANELNLEKTQFKIEEIMKDEDDDCIGPPGHVRGRLGDIH